MVKEDLQSRGIFDIRVLSAMSKVPRHLFIDEKFSNFAYRDSALPIAENQTISQPYIVALMTQTAQLKPNNRVLEIGTGSAYQAAVLSELVSEVYTIEIIESLSEEAKARLQSLEYKNVKVKHGDGFQGWKEFAPFDAILITAATPKIPPPLWNQLKVGGIMVLPLEDILGQDLVKLTKTSEGIKREIITGVRFVPMTGKVREAIK